MKNGNLINSSKQPMDLERHGSRSRLKCKLVILVLVILLCILTAFMFYILFSVKTEVCTTATCVLTSMELLHYIDQKADPCDDFYQFSCGNFLKDADLENVGAQSISAAVEEDIKTKIKNMLEEPVQDRDRLAFQKAKKFYKACMNETEIEMQGLVGMRSIFKVIGGWPTLRGDRWNEDQFEWKKVVYRLRAVGVNAEFFFKVMVDISEEVDPRYILGIHAMAYSPSEIETNTREKFLEYMVDVARIFGANTIIAKRDSNEVIDLLLKLAKEYEDSVKKNKTGQYDLYNLSELQHIYPDISWKEYLNGTLFPAQNIMDDELIVIREPQYLDAVLKILKNTSKRTLANFIAWHTLQHLMNYLPARVVDSAYEFLGKLNGKITKKPRWITCIESTQERMDSVVSAAYTEKFFTEKSRRGVEEIILNIKIQFKDNLRRAFWLDDKSKALIIEGFLNSVQDIGSYNDLMEIHSQNQDYDQAEVYEDKLLQSVLNLDFISLNMKFGKLRKPVKENWLGKSSFVTGIYVYYSPQENVLRFPAGIFGGVYYQDDRPRYMNYGAVGSIIAHEISHIFMKARDPTATGELQSRWSMDSLVRYGERLGCLSDHYGKFHVGELNRQLNSEKTKDEDMADLAGVKVSYDTYTNWVKDNGVEPRLPGLEYSPLQLFWISSAVRHCAKYSPKVLKRYSDTYQWSPPQFRVNGPLQNLHDFAIDFGCPVGSRMNPETKCDVW